MATLEFVQTYLDDLLIISKGSFDNHLKKLREVLIKLQEAWLKIRVICQIALTVLKPLLMDPTRNRVIQ